VYATAAARDVILSILTLRDDIAQMSLALLAAARANFLSLN
jgi:hypothetical protein